MCGISGAAWTDPALALSESALARMIRAMEHRGPDDSGTHFDDHVALGFRRLSIVDVAGSHQPLANEDRSIWTVFNGEIYNFPSLRRRLEAKGHVLATKGDTEVIVHLYEDEGPDFVKLLRGMFSLAVWDAPRRKLVLARDRMGQKPLHYRLDRGRILFSSELKSLLALPESDVPRRLDPLSIDRYLTFGYINHPHTILRDVHKLPPAHVGVWSDGKFSLSRYWEPDWNAEADRPLEEDVENLRALLAEAVREQMVADVPLGAFLSGGVDSTIIVGLMQKFSSRPVKTFSIGFPDPAFDETRFAESAARHLGTEHHSFRVEPKAWETLPALSRQFDEPFADSSALPTWHVSEQTRRHVTVALTGDAGDELFAGYDRYRAVALAREFDRLPAGVRSALGGPVARSLPASARAKTRIRKVKRLLEAFALPAPARYARWIEMTDESTRADLYTDEFLEELTQAAATDPTRSADPSLDARVGVLAGSRRDAVTQATITDILTYLPGDLLVKVDLASMAHSLECRGPFLDHRVVELALAMPIRHKLRLRGGRSKLALKRAFADLLPDEIKTRPKMGFGVPIDRWFRNELKDELRAALLDPSALNRGLFRPEAVERLIVEHESAKKDHAYRLWALLMLELWFKNYMTR